MSKKKSVKKCKYERAYRIVYRILRPFAYPAFIWRYNVKINLPKEIKQLKPPYLIVGNHVNKWDPFILSGALGKPVSYIASDHLFRTPFLRTLLLYLGAIPKTKFQSDTKSIRRFFQVKECGGVLGVYPEGQVNWAGKTLEFPESTAKLFRLLKLPVVNVKTVGGTLTRPRWMRKRVKGSMTLNFSLLFSADDVKRLKPEELNEKLKAALEHDDWVHFHGKKRLFDAKNRADKIDDVLYICPECNSIGTIKPGLHNASCEKCGLHIDIDEYGELKINSDKHDFPHISAWDQWQNSYLKESISKGDLNFSDGAKLFKGYRDEPIKPLTDWGTLAFSVAGFTFTGEEIISFPIENISGINVQETEAVEFYYDGDLYKIVFKGENFSAYKWFRATTFTQQLMKSETE